MMDPKLVLIPFSGQERQTAALECGLRLAQRHEAHAAVWHISFDPQYMTVPYGLYDIPVYAEEAYKEIKKINQDNWLITRTAYAAAMKRLGIPNSETSIHNVEGMADEVIAELGRTADLIVITRPDAKTDDGARQMAQSCLFSSGHPVLLVPPGKSAGKLKQNTLIAWNGSAEAGRAVTAALPYLKQGKIKILVGHGRDNKESLLQSAGNLVQYLRHHGVDAEIISTAKKESSLPADILDHATQMKAGLLVMGAYTHSRFRETIMGGVTQFMLDKADLPVLMCH